MFKVAKTGAARRGGGAPEGKKYPFQDFQFHKRGKTVARGHANTQDLII